MKQSSIDFVSRHVVIRCLKKRGKTIFRSIPLPSRFLDMLRSWIKKEKRQDGFLWPWSRMTGYRRIRDVMNAANIRGHHASPKGLRHGFGVRAVQSSVPLTLIQRWLGHADIKTTAIYTNAIGPEERRIASRMWRTNAINKPTPEEYAPATPDNSLNGKETEESNYEARMPPSQSRMVNSSLTFLKNSDRSRHICVKTQELSPKHTYGKIDGCSLIQFWLNCINKLPLLSTSYKNFVHLHPLQRLNPEMGRTTMPQPIPMRSPIQNR